VKKSFALLRCLCSLAVTNSHNLDLGQPHPDVILGYRSPSVTPSPHRRNVPLFILFRVLFNARWYYPVMAVLFLDLGLTVEQYALLNVAWAAAIVGLEVPSGAMADRFGRKKMIVAASVLMVIEMLIFGFAPRSNPALLFTLFLINRVFSGAAEASASGADEALAYDSLVVDGREKQWPDVLARVMKWQSIAFFATMMLGAAVYDAEFLAKVTSAIGVNWKVSKDLAMRLPIFLTLGNAVLALIVTLNLREPPLSTDEPAAAEAGPWKATMAAGRWILGTPVVLSLIVCGLCFDSIIRLFMTFQSSYFKVIGLPVAIFGVLGSLLALMGFVVPMLAKRMVAKWPMQINFSIVAVMVLASLAGAAMVFPIYGLLFSIPLAVAMGFIQFFVSHYLNALVTDSRKRATILSFRGLAFNLGYGAVGLLFAGLTKYLSHAHGTPSADEVFVKSLGWLPWYFLATFGLMALFVKLRVRRIPQI
jgi:MFS family permease